MNENEKRLMSAEEVSTYLGLGKSRGIEYAKKIGAEIRIGRRCLYDKKVVDQYLDKLIGA